MAKLYGWLAGIVAILVVVGVIYGKGQLDARHAAETDRLQRDLALAVRVIDQERDARQQDAILAAEASKRQAALNTKIDELNAYVDTLEDRDRQCLSGADVERLRDLWE